MVEIRIQKFGDSFGVILPAEVLTRLNCREGDMVTLVANAAGGYALSPGDSSYSKTMAAAEDLMRRYRETLRELAKY